MTCSSERSYIKRNVGRTVLVLKLSMELLGYSVSLFHVFRGGTVAKK